MEHSTKPEQTIDQRVSKGIEDLLALSFDGCIAGSCLLPESFANWESEPDIDFFAYSEVSWIYTISSIAGSPRYIPATKKDEWKLSRLGQGKQQQKNKYMTQTLYFKDLETETYLNISYKPHTSNVLDVLSRFDTIAVMVGVCCRTKALVDLRDSFHSQDHQLPVLTKGHANPIRLWYMVEGWDEDTWVRELSRIQKYKARGYEMNDMAISLLNVASQVLEKGEVVGSEKSQARYLALMLSCYKPVRWLEAFVGLDDDNYSAPIFNEILKIIQDLPTLVQLDLLKALEDTLLPDESKVFSPEDEEEVAPYDNPTDR